MHAPPKKILVMSKRSITPRTVLNVIVYEAEGAASTKCYAHKAPADIKVGR